MMVVLFRQLQLNWIETEAHPWPMMRITTRPAEPLKLRVDWRKT